MCSSAARGLLVVFIFMVISSGAWASGFDEICAIYTQALESREFNELSADEQGQVLRRQVMRTIKPGPVLEAYEKASSTVRYQQYVLFREAAEVAAGQPWDCLAMEVMSMDAASRAPSN